MLTHISQILVAFVIQSLIAVIVSGYNWILYYAIQKRWNAADPEPQTSRSHAVDPNFLSPKKGVALVLFSGSEMQGSFS
jgi:hypothetical protein